MRPIISVGLLKRAIAANWGDNQGSYLAYPSCEHRNSFDNDPPALPIIELKETFPVETIHCAVFLIVRSKVLLFRLDESCGEATGTWCPPSKKMESKQKTYYQVGSYYAKSPALARSEALLEEARGLAVETLKEDARIDITTDQLGWWCQIPPTHDDPHAFFGFFIEWDEEKDGGLPSIPLPALADAVDFFDLNSPPDRMYVVHKDSVEVFTERSR